MTLFLTLGWQQFGGVGLLLIAGSFGGVALALAEWLLRRRQLAIPAAITAALAVALVPLAVHGAQHALGFWPADGAQGMAYREYHRRIDWRWLLMELAMGRQRDHAAQMGRVRHSQDTYGLPADGKDIQPARKLPPVTGS